MDRALPTIDRPDGACCAACAAEQALPRPASIARSPARPVIVRGTDRRITFGGVAVAAILLGIAGASAMLAGPASRPWLPLHLAMAGAAGTAIAAVLPFFTAALAQVGPARPVVRIMAIAMIGGGAVVAAAGMVLGEPLASGAGGTAYVAGLAALAAAAFLPLRAALGSRLRLVHVAYAAAMAQVAIGVILATTMLAGWAPVVGRWAALKPAHAWLNVFGFLALVVAATLVHLGPTVAGARIRPRRSVTVALAGLIGGPPLVAVGFATGWHVIGGAGAIAELVGMAALAAHGAAVQRDRGRWTSDFGWHRFAGLSLLLAPVWLLVAVGIGAGRILWFGATPGAWSVDVIAIPLVAGGIGQVLVGAWTHLIPAIGPGDQGSHAVQRRWLGQAATTRWLGWNAGTSMATIGVLAGSEVLVATGGALLGAALVAGLVLLGASLVVSSWRDPVAAA